jgi:hypothetical protein
MTFTTVVNFYESTPSAMKEIGWKDGLSPLEGDNLLVIYYPSTSEIWLDKRGDLWWKLLWCENLSFINNYII